MITNGKLLDEQTVKLERLLPGSIETVWAYLTESEKRAKWLAAGEMETSVGRKVELLFNHANLSPVNDDEAPTTDCGDGTLHHGTITAYDAPHTLAYTWAENTGGNSEVMFQLTTEGDMVRLTITHQRLANMEEITGVSAGWDTHVGILEAHLAGQIPQPFWGIFNKTKAAYEQQYAS